MASLFLYKALREKPHGIAPVGAIFSEQKMGLATAIFKNAEIILPFGRVAV
jgi:hypothetical protein